MRVIDSPSIVPDSHGDVDIVSALNIALATIQDLVVYDDELKKWFVADESDPLFETVPGLIDHVRKFAHANTQSKSQGARAKDRRAKYDRRKVARARGYQKRRSDPLYGEMSDTDLKALCGQRLVPAPFKPGKFLPALARSQAIAAIDAGLKLIETGRFTLTA